MWRPLIGAALSAAIPAAASGQSLRLSAARPSGTEAAVIEISLESPAGKAPTALQWEMTIEGTGTTFVQGVLPASTDSLLGGKSVRCGLKASTSNAQTSVCMLVGGVEAIPNGKFARVQVHGPAAKGTKSVKVRLERAFGVYADLRRVELQPVDLRVAVSRRRGTT